jgi:hypothetical protein
LVLVERLTPSERKKEMAGGVGAGIVEALAPNNRKEERERGLYWVLLGTSAHKEGAVAVVTTTQKKKTRGNTESRKKRRCKHSPQKKRNGYTTLGCSGQTALRREQCDGLPESRNSVIRWEVDFLGNELLRRLHDNS